MALPADIEAALRVGDRCAAARLAYGGLANAPGDPELIHLAAYHCIESERLDEALELINRALELAPENASILNTLGNLRRKRGEFEDALAIFRQLRQRDSKDLAALFNLARLLEDIGDNDGARSSYLNLIDLSPADAEALARLFYLAAVEGDYDAAASYGKRAVGPSGAEHVYGQLSGIALQRADYPAAREFGEKAVEANPTPRAITALAHAEFRSGDALSAKRRLKALLNGTMSLSDRAFALSILGDVEDRLGDTGKAFANYAKSKSTYAEIYASEFSRPGQLTARALVEDLHAFFFTTSAPPGRSSADVSSPRHLREHVFLVGFPRSGTTLLETSLASHPDISTLDEAGRLMESTEALWTTAQGRHHFVNADDSTLQPFRDAYWREVRRVNAALDGKVLIDKMPLNSLLLPYIERLFPDAKIIFALRDPRDVVLSCFRTRFVMTAFMYEFCTIESAARFYDASMKLIELYRERLRLLLLDTRYEDLVADFPGAITAICQLLGVTPHHKMYAPEERARSRLATTPSGAQIARGLFDGSRQWRRYAEALTPVAPFLDSWVRRFGYSVD